MRVLVADDDPAARFILVDLLSEWGYEVVAVADGRKAHAVLSAQDAPQLALLDWMMPGMDGPEICSRISQKDGLLFIYSIILTSKSEKKDLATALEAGADDFLSKPIDNDELRSRLAVGVRAVEYERSLIEKNRQLAQYANRMDALAEERARQLIHAERLSMLGALTAGIAHEMSNPLTSVLANIKLIEMDWGAVEPHIRQVLEESTENKKRLALVLEQMPTLLDDARTASERVTRFLQDLKGFSRKDNGFVPDCAVNGCVENALSLGAYQLKYGITVEKDLGESLPTLCANPQQLEQVFLNLFTNAADAMAPRGRGILKIVSRQADDCIKVTVEDTGCGIPEDKLDAIWEAFFTTKEMGKGTGLGLSISLGIVENHNGSIRVENKPEGGARFIVELPV